MSAPQKDESPGAAGHFENQSTNAANVPLNQDKQFATVQAELALQGHTLQRAFKPDGTCNYLATRWGVSRYMPTLDDVERFLVQIGGRK